MVTTKEAWKHTFVIISIAEFVTTGLQSQGGIRLDVNLERVNDLHDEVASGAQQ